MRKRWFLGIENRNRNNYLQINASALDE